MNPIRCPDYGQFAFVVGKGCPTYLVHTPRTALPNIGE